MTGPDVRRAVYIVSLVVALVVWVAVGDIASVEAPYVGF
jgi:hypothetical protein